MQRHSFVSNPFQVLIKIRNSISSILTEAREAKQTDDARARALLARIRRRRRCRRCGRWRPARRRRSLWLLLLLRRCCRPAVVTAHRTLRTVRCSRYQHGRPLAKCRHDVQETEARAARQRRCGRRRRRCGGRRPACHLLRLLRRRILGGLVAGDATAGLARTVRIRVLVVAEQRKQTADAFAAARFTLVVVRRLRLLLGRTGCGGSRRTRRLRRPQACGLGRWSGRGGCGGGGRRCRWRSRWAARRIGAGLVGWRLLLLLLLSLGGGHTQIGGQLVRIDVARHTALGLRFAQARRDQVRLAVLGNMIRHTDAGALFSFASVRLWLLRRSRGGRRCCAGRCCRGGGSCNRCGRFRPDGCGRLTRSQ